MLDPVVFIAEIQPVCRKSAVLREGAIHRIRIDATDLFPFLLQVLREDRSHEALTNAALPLQREVNRAGGSIPFVPFAMVAFAIILLPVRSTS